MAYINLARDRMRFTKNKASANLAYVAILCNVLYFVSLYSTNVDYYYNTGMGASVVYNLLFLLGVFLCSEGVKGYNVSYAITLIVIGALQIVRIFKIPLEAFNATAVVSGVERAVMELDQFIYVTILLTLSAVACIVAGVICYLRAQALAEHNKLLEELDGAEA